MNKRSKENEKKTLKQRELSAGALIGDTGGHKKLKDPSYSFRAAAMLRTIMGGGEKSWRIGGRTELQGLGGPEPFR